MLKKLIQEFGSEAIAYWTGPDKETHDFYVNGNAIEVNEPGYFLISASVTATPTAAEDVTVVVYENGTPLPGAIATSTVGEAGNSTNLSIVSTIRKGCCGDNLLSTLTFVLTSGAGVIDNISIRIEKA